MRTRYFRYGLVLSLVACTIPVEEEKGKRDAVTTVAEDAGAVAKEEPKTEPEPPVSPAETPDSGPIYSDAGSDAAVCEEVAPNGTSSDCWWGGTTGLACQNGRTRFVCNNQTPSYQPAPQGPTGCMAVLEPTYKVWIMFCSGGYPCARFSSRDDACTVHPDFAGTKAYSCPPKAVPSGCMKAANGAWCCK